MTIGAHNSQFNNEIHPLFEFTIHYEKFVYKNRVNELEWTERIVQIQILERNVFSDLFGIGT